MEFCSCKIKTWGGTMHVNGVLVHGACGKPLLCTSCDRSIVAFNLGTNGPECQKCSPLFSDAFFSEQLDLERNLIDGFVYHFGGALVTDLMTGKPVFKNADYYFEEADVVTELKILKTEFASTSEHLTKFEALVREWLADGRLSHASWMGLEPIPEAFVHAHMMLLRQPIEGITKKANKQIKQTKDRLGLSGAEGLVLYLNDGFYQLNPNLIMALIGDPMTRQMRSIDGYVVFNLRREVFLPGDPFGRIFWLPKYRSSDDAKLSEFVNKLGAAWFRHLEELSGHTFASRIESTDPEHPEMTQAAFGPRA